MKTLQVSDLTKCNSARRPSFKPLLEDALQVLKGPLHNPEAKDFRKIISVMKNCYFFRENFSSQVALSEFVELAKFYVGYEVHKYGTVLLNDKEYADRLCIILDGSVEKIFQKPYGEVEEQIKDKRRGVSCSGLDLSPLKAKVQLPFLKSPRVLESFMQSPEGSLTSLTRTSTPRANSISTQPKKVLRLSSQQRDFRVPTLEDEALPQAKSLNFFEDLMKFIVNKKPEMKRKYFTEDILRADKVKTLTTGDYFGESFCVQNHPKSNYMFAVSSPEAHLLTLTKEDYNEVMRQLENRNYKKLEAFIKLFPLCEKDELQRFSDYFSQKSFQADEVIYFQGGSAQDLYIVQSGEIQLLRKPSESRGSSFIPITSVVKDQVFGEEVLLDMESRQESAIASVSNTSVYVLKASLIPEIEKEFEDIFIILRKGAGEKFEWRQEKAQELFEKNENNSTSISEYSPPRSFSPTKDISKSLFNPRHSIQIPNRRSFILEKSPVQSNSASHLPSSLTSIFAVVSPRKLSDGSPQKAQKSELYKSRFGRASVISDISQITRPGERITSFQRANLSPVSDLKAINFRNDLYGGSANNSRKSSPNGNDTLKKIQTISNKETKNQTPFKIMIKKRVAN